MKLEMPTAHRHTVLNFSFKRNILVHRTYYLALNIALTAIVRCILESIYYLSERFTGKSQPMRLSGSNITQITCEWINYQIVKT
jgi:hypothetical protein